MATQQVLELTDDNFDAEVINADKPVLVDFWAEWCQPCRLLGPTIDQLADENEGKVRVGKVDIDKNQQTAMKYKINAIPTVLLFSGGEVKKQFVGISQKGDLQAAIDDLAS
jgi:thioredoxin 1